MHLSKYRSIGGSHRRRKNLRGCFMDEPARRVSFVVETPSKRTEVSDFVYEVQLLNQSDETAEYCLKHW